MKDRSIQLLQAGDREELVRVVQATTGETALIRKPNAALLRLEEEGYLQLVRPNQRGNPFLYLKGDAIILENGVRELVEEYLVSAPE